MNRRALFARVFPAAGALRVVAAAPAFATADEEGLALPAPDARPAAPVSLQQALVRRRSVRSYAPQALPLVAVAQLLWAAQGITATGGRRTPPSAGALYPLELHVAAARVADLAPGLYRYVAASHRLHPTAHGDILPALARASFSQQAVADAAAVVVIAAVEERTARKYGARASRYVAFEAGAASQNLALQAAALGLGTVVVGAFDDDAVARAARLAPGERPIALMPLGLPGPPLRR